MKVLNNQRRLQKELLTMIKEPPQGMTVDTEFMEGGSSDQGGSNTSGSLSLYGFHDYTHLT